MESKNNLQQLKKRLCNEDNTFKEPQYSEKVANHLLLVIFHTDSNSLLCFAKCGPSEVSNLRNFK